MSSTVFPYFHSISASFHLVKFFPNSAGFVFWGSLGQNSSCLRKGACFRKGSLEGSPVPLTVLYICLPVSYSTQRWVNCRHFLISTPQKKINLSSPLGYSLGLFLSVDSVLRPPKSFFSWFSYVRGNGCSIIGSHWEQRVFAGEIMSPVATEKLVNTYVSRVSV